MTPTFATNVIRVTHTGNVRMKRFKCRLRGRMSQKIDIHVRQVAISTLVCLELIDIVWVTSL